MDKKLPVSILLIAIVAFTGALIGTNYAFAQTSAPGPGQSASGALLPNSNSYALNGTISVSGQAEMAAAPDEAQITLGFSTESQSASDAQAKASFATGQIITALKNAGVSEANISTAAYYVAPITSYSESSQTYFTRGYSASHILLIKTSDINGTGLIIDAASGAGANQISGIVFTLSDSHQKDLEAQALKTAAMNAKDKANAIAQALGVTISRPAYVSEGYSNFVPYFGAAPAAAGVQSTNIMPGQVSVSAQVEAGFFIA
jgi:uncharacterized protein